MPASNPAANRIEAGHRDRFWRVIDKQVNPGGGLDGADVSPAAADDAVDRIAGGEGRPEPDAAVVGPVEIPGPEGTSRRFERRIRVLEQRSGGQAPLEGERMAPAAPEMSWRDVDYKDYVETPHVKWATPLDGGKLRVFASWGELTANRMVNEIMQRVDADVDTVTMATGNSIGWGFCGPLYGKRTQKDIDDGERTLPRPDGQCKLSNVKRTPDRATYDLVKPPIHLAHKEKWRKNVKMFVRSKEYRLRLHEARTSKIGKKRLPMSEEVEGRLDFNRQLARIEWDKLEKKREITRRRIDAMHTLLSWAKSES